MWKEEDHLMVFKNQLFLRIMFEMLTSSDVLQKCPAPATVSSGPLAEAS
jgi:hypothetical protein